jgi:gliding motility-associated-like protein
MSKYLLFISLLISSFLTIQFPALAQQTASSTTVSSTIWEEQEPYVQGFARVMEHNKFSFINNSGQLIHPVAFEGARNFNNHLAAIKQDDKWGFMDESGIIIIPCAYQIAFDFSEQVTAVYKNKNWQLINIKGEVVKALNITAFFGFKNGIAKISKDGKWGTMNSRGEITLTNTPINPPVINTSQPKSFIPSTITSASVCPDNIDFEFGSFLNWECFIGKVDSVGPTNVITVTPSPPTPNRHTLYSRAAVSPLDAFGLFPTNPPDGSNFALKLGNTKIGAEAERVRYKIRVPTTDSNFSIKYDYAVVFEDPGHTIWTQPRFNVKIVDSASNSYVQCASFEYISTSNLPGFARSTVDTGVMYKPWSTVFLSLRGYAGKTMYLEFTTADCVRRGHWGYAYVDVEKPCGQSVEMNYECSAPNITTLTAPPGFQSYNWWNQTYGTLLGTGQQIVLNPGPTVNSVIWLEMIPYSNFGCKDTVKVTITGIFTANFTMSDTVGVCAPHSFTFYNTNLPSTSVLWDFGDGTTGTGDTVSHIYLIPGTFLVKMHVVLPGGCIGDIIKTVSVLQPVGNFSFDQTVYCNNQTVQFDANVSSSDSLIWNFGDGVILRTRQTTVFHTYLNAGIYLPSLTLQSNNGCKNTVMAPDTVRIELLNPGYMYTEVRSCGKTTLNFTDTSKSYFGISNRMWDFGDGTSAFGINVSHTYTTSGTYPAQLVIFGTLGCAETIAIPLDIIISQPPVATISGVTSQCQSVPVTFTSNVTATDPINFYHWQVSNGFTDNGTTLTTTFNQAGTYTITFIAGTVNGCFDTTTHQIVINPTPDVATPPNQTLCSLNSSAPVNFTSTVSGTTFTWTNTAPIIGLAASGTGNIPSFIAYSNGASIANAGITVRPIANGCPGPAKIFTITVKPTPNVLQPANQTLCNNSNTSAVTFTGAVSGTTFNWTNDNPAIGLAASGTGNIPSFTAKANTSTAAMATITVTPTENGCEGPAKNFIITVNPTPDVAKPIDQTLCNNSNTAPIIFTSAVNNTIYSWTNSNPAIGLTASGTGNIASFIAVGNPTGTSVATISITPTNNGCTGIPKNFDIIVNPINNVAQPADQALCNEANTTAINFAGTVTGTTYSWTNNNALVGLAAAGTGDIATFKAINKTALPVTATITVSPVSASCPGLPKTFDILIHPTPDVEASSNAIVCLGNTMQLNATGATQYSWSPAANLSCVGCANPMAKPTDSILYTVKGSNAAGCFAFDSVMLSVIKPFAMTVSPNDTLCVGNAVNISAFNASRYVWSPGIGLNRTDIANPTVKTNTSTTYRVVGYDNHQCFTDTGFVTIIVGYNPNVNIGPDRNLSTGTILRLNAITSGGPIVSWMWTPAQDLSCNNCPAPTTTVKNNSVYAVTVTNTFGCTAADTILINSFCKSAQVFIPNAFSPDGDGLNDVLMVRGRGVTVKSFRIFNRWGELVFEKSNFYPNDLKFGWDGKVKGIPASPDVFVYTAEVICDNDIPYTYKGNITILK